MSTLSFLAVTWNLGRVLATAMLVVTIASACLRSGHVSTSSAGESEARAAAAGYDSGCDRRHGVDHRGVDSGRTGAVRHRRRAAARGAPGLEHEGVAPGRPGARRQGPSRGGGLGSRGPGDAGRWDRLADGRAPGRPEPVLAGRRRSRRGDRQVAANGCKQTRVRRRRPSPPCSPSSRSVASWLSARLRCPPRRRQRVGGCWSTPRSTRLVTTLRSAPR